MMTDLTLLSPADEVHLTHAIEVARASRAAGNHPFGAGLVTADGTVIEGHNTVTTTGDPTCHAETNLVRLASAQLTPDVLRTSTMYASTEPCPMCAGAIYWAGISRLVYGLPEQALSAMVPSKEGDLTMDLPCREVFARGGSPVIVAGPALLGAATEVHQGFWDVTH